VVSSVGKRKVKPTYAVPRIPKRITVVHNHYFKGDDLDKVKQDRKLSGVRYEEWERRRKPRR